MAACMALGAEGAWTGSVRLSQHFKPHNTGPPSGQGHLCDHRLGFTTEPWGPAVENGLMDPRTVGRSPEGRPIRAITLGGAPGVELELLDLGATVSSLTVECGDGRRRNVVLGHAAPEGYVGTGLYLGSTVGRYANRIARGRFELDGRTVQVARNDRGNSLHGGPDGFDQRSWTWLASSTTTARLGLVSPDGDQGFPGELTSEVEFHVTGQEVHVAFRAWTDRPTVANLTQHAYFNLDGEGAGSIDDHLLHIAADQYTPVDDAGIPVGANASVDHSLFDFRAVRRLGAALSANPDHVAMARGLDHNFVLRGHGQRRCAVLESQASQTRLEVFTDQPGLQAYAGGYFDGSVTGRSGQRYRRGAGIALEPQSFPDSPNRSDFPSTVLRPGETYEANLVWRFTGA